MTRRAFLKVGAVTVAGIAFTDWLDLLAATPSKDKTAKSVIYLWMGGGPCHVDTFDPKPGAGEAYCGPYRKPIDTNVPGTQIGELLPLMAKQADKYTILRGMTHPSNGHETATYIMQTGTLPTGDLVYPAMGAVVALKREEQGLRGTLPPYITVTNPLGRFSEAGFLGSRYQPFATGGDPKAKDFRVGGMTLPAGMTPERLHDRQALLEAVDTLGKTDKDAQLAEMDAYRKKAYELLSGKAREAFDLSAEKDDLRDRYGRTTFGQACLLARRLVENSVPFITVNWGGWDTHSKHFERMAEMLPVLDKGFSALLEDLSRKGLLESTIIVWGGEFGRTPKVAMEPPWNGGRHHYCTAFSCVVAGGGFAGGKVVGVTDRTGEKVVARPVYPWDLSASIYKLMGIDPAGRLPHPQGRVVYVTPPVAPTMAPPGTPKTPKNPTTKTATTTTATTKVATTTSAPADKMVGGILKEIMPA